jgi:phospholipase C
VTDAIVTWNPSDEKGKPAKPHYRPIWHRPVPLASVKLAAVTRLILFTFLWGYAGRDVTTPKGIEQVQHVIVIYMENWSFDGQFGLFPGANDLADAGDTISRSATKTSTLASRRSPPASNK